MRKTKVVMGERSITHPLKNASITESLSLLLSKILEKYNSTDLHYKVSRKVKSICDYDTEIIWKFKDEIAEIYKIQKYVSYLLSFV